MKRTTVVALFALALGVLVFLAIARQAPPTLEAGEASPEASAPAPELPAAAPASAEQTQPTEAADRADEPGPQQKPAANTLTAQKPETPAQPASQPEPPQEPPRASGPIEELKARLKSDPRDARAQEYEELIRRSFREKDVPEGLLESALCKKSVCRVSLRWAPDRHMGTMAGLMRLIPSFAEQVAFDPAATANRTGETAVDVYFARKPEE